MWITEKSTQCILAKFQLTSVMKDGIYMFIEVVVCQDCNTFFHVDGLFPAAAFVTLK